MTDRSPRTSKDGQVRYWTNRSVLEFAGEMSPIDAMIRRVRALTMEAIDKGWAGPPFDPFRLADYLKIDVLPSQEVPEARTVPSGSRFRIEYNPDRGTDRARYSIAHEIAHTLFSDCADAVRNRTSYHGGQGDNWQLEMLCNIGAAELLMPVGSGLECPLHPHDFTKLLDLRHKYKVSAEALLLRMARLCGLTVFAASFDEISRRPSINYFISHTSNKRLREGTVLPLHSVVTECTAIGFTAEGTENWPSVGAVSVQCVGAPPYPGHVRPRVLGVVRSLEDVQVNLLEISYVRGDATNARGAGPKILVQVVNDKAHTWGGGLSLSVRRKWPKAQKDFTAWFGQQVKIPRLGQVHLSNISEDLIVASIVAQAGYGDSSSPRIRYRALESGLRQVGERASELGASVHMPKLGCGQAGGSWNIVGELVALHLLSRGIPVMVYDLPGQALERQPSIPGLFTAERPVWQG